MTFGGSLETLVGASRKQKKSSLKTSQLTKQETLSLKEITRFSKAQMNCISQRCFYMKGRLPYMVLRRFTFPP